MYKTGSWIDFEQTFTQGKSEEKHEAHLLEFA